jgi:two-component system, sensor histidine kinase YesM
LRHLQDEVRITFTKYAIVPVCIIAAICIVFAIFYWNKNVLDRNTESRELVADVMTGIVTDYEDRANAVARHGYDLEELKDNRSAQTALYTTLYHEVNITHDNTAFYLLDSNRQILLSNRAELPLHLQTSMGDWGILHRMEHNPLNPLIEFAQTDHLYEQDMVVGQALLKNGKVDGYIVFVVPGAYLRQAIFSPYVQFVIADAYDSTPIATTQLFSDEHFHKLLPYVRDVSGMIAIGEQHFYSSQQEILNGRLRVYAFSPIGNMLAQYLTGAAILLSVLLIMIPVIVFSVRRETRSKMKAIDELVAAFGAVKEGNLNRQTEIHTGNEFEIIGNAYNRMVKSLTRLIELNKEKARATVVSEVRQLESQFNPHFLFNTLENIKFMVKLEPDAAVHMIIALSALLRYSINNEIQRVPLQEDLRHLKNYIEIQQYRFGKRLRYKEQFEQAALSCLIPKLLLQPVIENAMKYGADEEGNIYISTEIKICGSDLMVSIMDGGAGIGEETLKRLHKLLRQGENGSVHTGVYNIHRRIQLLYGKKYGLQISRPVQGGTEVRFLLPVVMGEGKE